MGAGVGAGVAIGLGVAVRSGTGVEPGVLEGAGESVSSASRLAARLGVSSAVPVGDACEPAVGPPPVGEAAYPIPGCDGPLVWPPGSGRHRIRPPTRPKAATMAIARSSGVSRICRMGRWYGTPARERHPQTSGHAAISVHAGEGPGNLGDPAGTARLAVSSDGLAGGQVSALSALGPGR